MFKEFKEFAMRGNVIDLAVGVIIGSAFGKIVSSFVNDILMPPIGLLMGNADFSDLFITLSGAKFNSLVQAQEAGAVTLNYGIFINTVIDFLIVAFVIFLFIKQLSKLNKEKQQPAVEPTEKTCPFCMSEIAIKATRCPNCTSKI